MTDWDGSSSMDPSLEKTAEHAEIQSDPSVISVSFGPWEHPRETFEVKKPPLVGIDRGTSQEQRPRQLSRGRSCSR